MTSARAIGLAMSIAIVLGGWAAFEWPARYDFDPAGRFWIEGTSTVHDFTCTVKEFSGSVEPAAGSDDPLAALQHVQVSVPVDGISCGNGTMDKKMRNALKSDSNPLITYELTNASATPAGENGSYQLQTTGNLKIAGEQRPVQMKVEALALGSGKVRFKGSTKVSLSEFKMQRPSAALGTIKTGDDVTVHFEISAVASQPGGSN